MEKYMYYEKKYFEKDVVKRIRRWVNDFNDTHHLLKEIKKAEK
jgi:hypothetical protein